MITMEIDLSNIFITNTAIARYLQSEREKQASQNEPRSSLSANDIINSLTGSGVLDGIVEGASTTAKNAKRKIKCIYQLRGMICYYGQHYSCYFKSPVTNEWYLLIT